MKTGAGKPIAFRPDLRSEEHLEALLKRVPLKPSDLAKLAAFYVWPRLLSGELSLMELMAEAESADEVVMEERKEEVA